MRSMIEEINLFAVTYAGVERFSGYKAGPYWFDLEFVSAIKDTKFTVSVFNDSLDDQIAVLEALKESITTALQEIDARGGDDG